MKKFSATLVAAADDQRKEFRPHTGSTDGNVRQALVGAVQTLTRACWDWAYRQTGTPGGWTYSLVLHVQAGPHVKQFTIAGESDTPFVAIRKQVQTLNGEVQAWASSLPEPPDGKRGWFRLAGR